MRRASLPQGADGDDQRSYAEAGDAGRRSTLQRQSYRYFRISPTVQAPHTRVWTADGEDIWANATTLPGPGPHDDDIDRNVIAKAIQTMTSVPHLPSHVHVPQLELMITSPGQGEG